MISLETARLVEFMVEEANIQIECSFDFQFSLAEIELLVGKL